MKPLTTLAWFIFSLGAQVTPTVDINSTQTTPLNPGFSGFKKRSRCSGGTSRLSLQRPGVAAMAGLDSIFRRHFERCLQLANRADGARLQFQISTYSPKYWDAITYHH